jgi:hypothetical protein
MARRTRAEIRQAARERVECFSAVLRIDDAASVRRGKFKHLDPDLPDSDGWWVDCQVFIPREEM